MVPSNGALVARIMDRVITDDNGCWLWQGSLYSAGHGQIWCEGRSWGTHRIIYAYYHGKIEDGLMVLHKCDVSNCCNPDHLEPGTGSKNALDCISRGRGGARGIKALRMVDAEDIRLRYWAGLKQRQLAKEFGVSIPVISRIVNYKIWNNM